MIRRPPRSPLFPYTPLFRSQEGRILLCRRAIEPRRGYWTVPAGFLENGETLQQGAARESLEEAQAEVAVGSLLSVVHVLHARSEEHTSELQSPCNLVCRLLLENKNNND